MQWEWRGSLRERAIRADSGVQRVNWFGRRELRQEHNENGVPWRYLQTKEKLKSVRRILPIFSESKDYLIAMVQETDEVKDRVRVRSKEFELFEKGQKLSPE